ncbi:hypothetical protein SESBI_20717 [Sesbania bispinosa]|nr:hypothetical protein SESBI_20717 [Sesbania bispinosa]
MELKKNTACVLLLFLCAAWLSTARLNPTGAKVYEMSDIQASIATSSATKRTTVKILAAIEGNLNVSNAIANAKQLVRKSASSEEDNRSVRSRRLYTDEIDAGLMAFSADYHRPIHHPPKNNK